MDQPSVMTEQGLAVLEAQLAELEGPGRRMIAERIRTAREWGDLKENAEYHDAKNEQSHLETKIARLRRKLADAVVVEPESSGDTVSFGSTVVVRGEDGGEQTWRLVSSHEASPADGWISVDSPMARALLGATPGAEVSIALPRGARRVTVISVD